MSLVVSLGLINPQRSIHLHQVECISQHDQTIKHFQHAVGDQGSAFGLEGRFGMAATSLPHFGVLAGTIRSNQYRSSFSNSTLSLPVTRTTLPVPSLTANTLRSLPWSEVR